jgi:Zn finger protein HypA/HybF involved in hydrogenase expression
MAKTEPIKVECLECGRKFQTRSMDPECPKCHGVDIDVRTVVTAPARRIVMVDPNQPFQSWNYNRTIRR